MKLLWRLGFVLLALFVFACEEEVKLYRIGVVIPLSGASDAYGRNVENGLKLALDEINSKGGVKGKNLDLLIEDDQSDEKVAVQKTKPMLDNVPIVIGGITSNTALALAPVCQKQKVILISPTATSPKLTGISQYFFRTFPSDTREGKIMAEYAVRHMKIRSVAILYVDKEYGQGLEQVFKTHFTELGGNVVYEKPYAEGTSDFSTFLKEIKDAKPDAVYLPGYYTEIAAILTEAKKQELNVKFLSGQGMATPMILEIAGDAAEGVVYPQPPYDPDSKNPEIQKFVQAYRAKYPVKPDSDSAFAYDTLWVVAQAIEKCENYPTDLRAKLADTNYHGITGDITFDSGGDVDIEPRMFQVKDGKFEPIK